MVSGTLFSYSYLCHKKVWYYYRGVSLESESQNVQIGKLIDEKHYSKEAKHFMVNNTINIDFFKENTVFEIKKSSSQKEMAIQQIKYYLYCLKQCGLEDVEGKLLVPLENKKESVFLEDGDIEEIEKQLKLIEKIKQLSAPPLVDKKGFCAKCAYYDLCQI